MKKLLIAGTLLITAVGNAGVAGAASLENVKIEGRDVSMIGSPTTTITTVTNEPAMLLESKTVTTIDAANNKQAVVFVSPTTASTVTVKSVLISRPDDLVKRREGLLARIAVERAHGTITEGEASDLLSRMNQAASVEASMRGDGILTWKEVKDLYKEFDRVGSKLDSYSDDTNRKLAGTYIVL